MPENQIAADVEEGNGSDFGITMGTMDAGVSRFGKWVMRGVLGGGSMRENSACEDVGAAVGHTGVWHCATGFALHSPVGNTRGNRM